MDKIFGLSFASAERKKICVCGKVCFDKRSAQTKKNWLVKKGREKFLRIYQCDQSNYWHLTSTKTH